MRGRNHWKVMPASESIECPTDEREQLKWAEALVDRISHGMVKRHFFFANQKYGYMITVVELDGLYYLIHSIRNEFKSYNNVVYVSDKNLQDLVSIGKMMQANIETIMKDYKDNMLRLRDDILKGKVRIDDRDVPKA